MTYQIPATEILSECVFWDQPNGPPPSGAIDGLHLRFLAPKKVAVCTGMLGLLSLGVVPGQHVPASVLKSGPEFSPSGIEIIHTSRQHEDTSISVVQEVVPITRKIAEIRYRFALNVSQLAEVLHVERPTIYAWMKGESDIRNANRERLDKIYQMTRETSKYLSGPISASDLNTKIGDLTLMQMLSGDHPNKEEIKSVLMLIEQSKASALLAEDPTLQSISAFLKSRNLPEPSENVQRVNFELGTDRT